MGSEAALLAALSEALEAATTSQSHVLVRGVGNLAGEAATWRRETVTRLLTDFKRKNLIQVKGATFMVLAKDRMQEMVSI